MHSNDTSITVPAEITGAPAASTTGRPRLRTLAGGVIAVGGLTFGIGAALAQESPSSVPAVSDHPAIAEMARSNGLSGLSPASLASTTSARSDVAVADWARSNGMTGLSPASLAPTSDVYGDSGAVADWARANGLSGLSPASLAVVEE